MPIFKSLYHLCRLGLAGLFLWAAGLKLARPEVFIVTVKAFGLLPGAWLEPLCYALIGLELLAGLLLLGGLKGDVALAGSLLALFIGILLYALRLGLDIDCGCYGPSEPQAVAFSSLRKSLWRDLGMAAGLAYVHFWRKFQTQGLNGLSGISFSKEAK